MEKNKYQRASKEEKRVAREEFFKTNFGQEQKKRLNRLLLYSALLLICAIYFTVENILNENSISTYVLCGFFVLFAIAFVVGRNYVIVKCVNEYMINKKKRK